ncbi:hypothetical protein CASFOL_031293 [Castilleja foliolosa]|uniref:Uncharacterized protein n=1 Tax=Castilleja foliolosa TaxID=1961234 RepID=A0ABD3C724_9LAMI
MANITAKFLFAVVLCLLVVGYMGLKSVDAAEGKRVQLHDCTKTISTMCTNGDPSICEDKCKKYCSPYNDKSCKIDCEGGIKTRCVCTFKRINNCPK